MERRDEWDQRCLWLSKIRKASRSSMEEIEWQCDCGAETRRGVLIGHASAGMTVVMDHGFGCCPGTVLKPSPHSMRQGWRRPIEVKRVVQLSDAIDLIAADYTGPADAEPHCDDDSPA